MKLMLFSTQLILKLSLTIIQSKIISSDQTLDPKIKSKINSFGLTISMPSRGWQVTKKCQLFPFLWCGGAHFVKSSDFIEQDLGLKCTAWQRFLFRFWIKQDLNFLFLPLQKCLLKILIKKKNVEAKKQFLFQKKFLHQKFGLHEKKSKNLLVWKVFLLKKC